jgi:hypothetical protein
MCGLRRQPLSAVPTLWARPRAVIELGGGRLPRHSPLGGGRAAYKGAQQPSVLELGSFSPHSHHLTASRAALSGSLFAPQVPPATCRSAPMGARGMGRSRRYPQAVAAAEYVHGVVVVVAGVTIQE